MLLYYVKALEYKYKIYYNLYSSVSHRIWKVVGLIFEVFLVVDIYPSVKFKLEVYNNIFHSKRVHEFDRYKTIALPLGKLYAYYCRDLDVEEADYLENLFKNCKSYW